jgi:hypothetical protein
LNEYRPAEITWNLGSYGRQTGVNMAGGSLSFTYNFNERVGVVADLGAQIDTVDNFDILNYRFGPKFSARSGERTTFFTQFLVGGARIYDHDTKEALVNGFSMLAGGGVDIGIKRWLAWRAIEGGFSSMHFNPYGYGWWSNGLRASTGLVFRIR